jgi:hypothetical protein
MNLEEAADFRDRLARELAQLDTSYQGTAARFGGLHEAAAVLAHFDPDTLVPSGLTPPEDIEDVLAHSVLEPGPDGSSEWSLKSDVRIDVLKQLATRERMLQALDANARRPDSTVQRTLEAYLRGNAPPFEELPAGELPAIFQVSRWLHPVLDGVPDTDLVSARIDFVSLLRPFRELADAHFSGRSAELRRLRDYVGVIPPESSAAALRQWLDKGVNAILNLHEKPPLMIHAPGGMGKSSLLARFILDHALLGDEHRVPFVYLDFDRPELRADEPVTLLVEAVRQLGLQYPHARQACERLRAEWQGRLAEAARHAPEGPDPSSTARGPGLDPARFVETFGSLLGTLNLARKPILWVIDTFEEVQYRSPGGVREVMSFLTALQSSVPRLRVVMAGRAPIEDHITESLALGELDTEASQAYLQKKGVSDPAIARRIAAELGGNALTLRLAAEIVQKEGFEALGAGGRMDQLTVQRQLFRRILARIHDPEVRKLAHPGLVLRRITPELIKEVLAGPCEMSVPDLATAARLFKELKREISVVAPSDAASVRHRPELRRIMLPLLERDRPDTIATIHRLAIDYYASKDDAVSRAEEIYHRLSLGQPSSVVDARWIPGVSGHLTGALEDLKPAQRAYLASRLGVETDAATRAAASIDDWERDAERRMRDWLHHDDPRQAIAVFRERSDRRGGTVLDGLAAAAFERLDQPAEAVGVLAKAIAASRSEGDPDERADLLFQLARLQLRLGDQAGARAALDNVAALQTTRGALDRARVAAFRLQLDGAADAALAETQVAVVREWLTSLDEKQLQAESASVREIVGVLTVDDGPVLARIVRLLGLDTMTPSQRQSLSVAIAAWDAEVSRASGEAPGMLARRIGLEQRERLAETWTALAGREPREIAQIVAGFLDKQSLASASGPVATALKKAVVEALGGAVIAPSGAGRAERSRTRGAVRPGRERGESVAPPDNTRLSGPQMRELHQALVDAFPSQQEIERLLFSVDRSLSAMTMQPTVKGMVLDVITTASAQAWVADLVIAALNSNPGNGRLQAIAQQLGFSASPAPREIERAIKRSHRFADVNEWRSRLGVLEAQVCRVEIGKVGQTGMGTGFLVAPDLVMTSYHVVQAVIDRAGTPDLVCRFDYRRLPDGRTYEGTEVRVSPGAWVVAFSPYHPSELLLEEDWNEPIGAEYLDYALLRLDRYVGAEPIGGSRGDSSGARRGWIDVSRGSGNLEPSPIYILQHPRGEPLKVAIDTEGIVGVNPSGTRMSYRVDTEPGSAGAPCFSAEWNLIAMHQGRRQQTGLGVGIPIDAIVQQLQQRGMYELLGGRGFA